MSGPGGVDSGKRQGGAGQAGGGAVDRVHVTSRGHFAVGSTVWRDARGGLVCTLVAKAAYELVPGECTLLKEPSRILAEDKHWNGDPAASVHIPGDLSPFKKAAELVVVGSAFAPGERPVARSTVRVVVGSVDKLLEVWSPRQFRRDGSIEEAPRKARFSLRYEHAAGGPDTENPVGIDVDRADAMARRPIPEILPHLFELGQPGDYIPMTGLGPIAASWRSRASSLSEQDRAWLRRPFDGPVPVSFPARYFQAAPPDQWLDRPLAANEHLVLEGLHAELPRLVTNLPAVEPRAIVVGGNQEPLRLQGDLLVVDTDRGIATLTFRGQVALDDSANKVRVIIVGMPMGMALPAQAVRQILESEDGLRLTGPKRTTAGASGSNTVPLNPPSVDLPPPNMEETSTIDPWEGTVTSAASRVESSREALPFSTPSPASRPFPSRPDGALPFRGTGSAAPSSKAPIPPAPVRPAPVSPPAISSPANPPPSTPSSTISPPIEPAIQQPPAWQQPWQGGSPPSPPASAIPSVSPWSLEGARAERKPGLPSLQHDSTAQSAAPQSAAPQAATSKEAPLSQRAGAAGSPSPAPVPKDAPAKPRATADTPRGFGAAFGSAKAVSDAAADQEKSKEPVPREKAIQSEKQPLRRHSVVDLLSFDAKLAARLRGMKRFAEIWTMPRGRLLLGADEPRAEESKERADILRVLSCGRVSDAAEVRGALAEGLEDLADFDLPLLLVAGELRPSFDEVETLRATVAIAQSVAGNDKKVLGSVALGQEALAASLPPRPDVAVGLSRQIEQASTSLSFPPRYVAAQAERMLVENRKYKRRTLLGEPRVRAELTMAGAAEALLIYLPDTAATSLPLLLSFPVLALCEVRPREDIAETHSEALFAKAFGRVLHSRLSEG